VHHGKSRGRGTTAEDAVRDACRCARRFIRSAPDRHSQHYDPKINLGVHSGRQVEDSLDVLLLSGNMPYARKRRGPWSIGRQRHGRTVEGVEVCFRTAVPTSALS